MERESLPPTTLWSRLLGWWSRPPARDRILSVLLEADDGSALQGSTIGQRAGVGSVRLYPALHRLEEEGLISHTEGMPAAMRGGRPRYYYALTSKGFQQVLSKIKRAS